MMLRRTFIKLAVASCLAPFIPAQHPYSRFNQMYAKRRQAAIVSFADFLEQTMWQPTPSILDDSVVPVYFVAGLLANMEQGSSCPPSNTP